MKPIILFAALVLLASCSKTETPAPSNNNNNPGGGGNTTEKVCRISKSTYNNTVYTYQSDASGKIVEETYTLDGKFQSATTYEYTGDILSKSRTYSDAAKKQLSRQNVYVKTTNSVTVSLQNGDLVESQRTVYMLSGGKLVEIDNYSVQDNQATLTNKIIVETDANGNSVKNSTDSYTIYTTYDSKKNLLLAYPTATILPTGKNNAVGTVMKDKNGKELSNTSYSYTYNIDGLPIANSSGTTYEYNCK
jgi:hypothetical protein